ncbi:MAG: L-2-amino-thiazoline-4-carboxylic acid hydrolase [Planctomycetota bacterium]
MAVYRAVTQYGGTAGEAWEICHEALRLRMAAFPRWRAWLLRKLMFSGLMMRRVRRFARAGRTIRHGDFETRLLIGNGEDFDFGIDYLRCGNLELVRKLGAEAFAPYVCMSDIALSEGLGWGLKRTQTLAAGCDHCDFRMRKNAATDVTSKIPAVQQTVDHISRQEADRT